MLLSTSLDEKAEANHPGAATRVPQKSVSQGEVHLWCASTEIGTARMKRGNLSEDEWIRVRQLAEGRPRETFFVTRTALRTLLCRYTGRDPRHLGLVYEESGKPHLFQPGFRVPLHFNLSHTAGLFGNAITTTGEWGFDIEHLDRRLDPFALAEQILTPRERAIWTSLPVEHRERGVLRYRTRKEAKLKARGNGLSVSQDTVEVGWHCAPTGGTLHSLAPSPGYIGCVAALWPIRRLELRWLVQRSKHDVSALQVCTPRRHSRSDHIIGSDPHCPGH